MSPSKQAKQHEKKKKIKQKKGEGWIWLDRVTRGQTLGDEGKLAEYKKESDQVQWFRTEAEMYCWLEQYERKHTELMCVIERFRHDSVVWAGLGDSSMYRRLEHNTGVILKDPNSGAHHDWVSAATFDELVSKIDTWQDVVFKWMDEMGIHRAYKDF
ncbi:hypothetical protein B0H10DRAFT_2229727 [Mycena sp. CBHHK59/15]|nr:hypothetical protein B0H10DRAFT_2229727 [Mycena sp. CBHHK59/15]